jgi:hypothetical protein
VLYTSLFYPGHPPYAIFRGQEKTNSTDQMAEAMHFFSLTDVDDGFSFFYNYDMWETAGHFRDVFFPDSPLILIDHKHFNKKLKEGEGMGPFFKVINITKEQMHQIRGLNAKYYFPGTGKIEDAKNEMPVFGNERDAAIPYNVTWEGGFMTPYFGDFRFINKGNASFQVWVDGKRLSPQSYYTLAMGLHNIIIKSSKKNVLDKLELLLDCKKYMAKQLSSVELMPCDYKMFYNLPRIGLHAYYYKGDAWDMEPAFFEYIDPLLWIEGLPIDYASSQKWFGNIRIPEDGHYRIFAQCNGFVRVVIDGRQYWEQNIAGNKADIVTQYFADKPMQKTDGFNLKKGTHKIAVYALRSSQIKLSWQAGTQPVVPLPMELLTPDYTMSEINRQ